ncbi:MAG: PQQ-dependent sugar dehydrogenase [Planctomycetes bacterium]|jgi:glucose/arabinose dehydrogenase|nr:PQQ-dependent sugar dehydrogenase [Planctomycetota bacterium]
MSKKVLIILVLLTAGLAGLVWFYRGTVRGLKPAVIEPPADIADLIDKANNASSSPDVPANATGLPLNLPAGFSIAIYGRGLEGVRMMIEDPGGGLLVSLTKKGEVVSLRDIDQSGAAEPATVLLKELYNPHGLAISCPDGGKCRLYVAETNAVSVYDYDPENQTALNRRKIIDLPDDGGHYTRSLLYGQADGSEKLLIAVGSSCNVCAEEDWRRAKILISEPDGSGLKAYASGLRNSVFQAVHPLTGEIWATDNGRDWLGDDLPPDEINLIKAGGNYGWPVCYGQNVHDTDYDKNTYIRNPCQEPFETPAKIDLPAHSAALGLDFFDADWPAEYRYNALAAFHGSWNRSAPTGYKVVRVKFDQDGKFLGLEDFVTGWLTGNNEALGRPVGILIRPGEIFISDDKAGVIYRLIYTKEKTG